MDCTDRTGCSACTAADAFGRLRSPAWIDVHFTDRRAFSTVNTLVCIHSQAIETHFVEQAINRSKRAGKLAEKTIDNNASDNCEDQQKELPAKKSADGLPEFWMCAQQRNAASQRARRADILAECRFAHADNISDKNGHKDNKDQENGILEILCESGKAQFFLRQRNQCKQFLNQAERAEKSAYKSAEQNADSQKKADDIKAEIQLHGA